MTVFPQALIDGPTKITGVSRQVLTFKRMSLTDLKVKIGRNAKQASLNKAWEKDEVMKKWEETAWAKNIAMRKKRAVMGDFCRFKMSMKK